MPDNAQYYAALGAVEFGKLDEEGIGTYRGTKLLRHYIDVGRLEAKQASGSRGLWDSREELDEFARATRSRRSSRRRSSPVRWCARSSASTAARPRRRPSCLTTDKNVLVKAYQLSKGNPIEDTKDMLGALQQYVEDAGATLEVMGIGATGYAADVLQDVRAGRREPRRDGRPHRVRAALLLGRGRHRRHRRPGHQADRHQERPGRGLPAQHPCSAGNGYSCRPPPTPSVSMSPVRGRRLQR